MTTVYMPGLWDLLHVGHVRALKRAKSLGHSLVVGVPSDEVVKEDKGRYPIIPLKHRLEMVRSLEVVDWAYVYTELGFLAHLNQLRPQILAVGSTWGSEQRHKDAEEWVETHQRKKVVIPYCDETSTTEICKKVLETRCNPEQ